MFPFPAAFPAGVPIPDLRYRRGGCGGWPAGRRCWSWRMCQHLTHGHEVPAGFLLRFRSGFQQFAAHIRAALDLLNKCEFDQLRGIGIHLFRDKAYIIEFFEKALLLKDHPGWKEISGFLSDEFQEKWCVFLKNKNMQ